MPAPKPGPKRKAQTKAKAQPKAKVKRKRKTLGEQVAEKDRELEALRAVLADRESRLERPESELARQTRSLDALRARADTLSTERDRLQQSLSALLGSREWRLLQLLRRVRERLAPYGTRRARWFWCVADALLKRPRHLRGQPGPLPAIIGGPDATAAAEFRKILERHADRRGVVIYPPLIDWGWMKQRPHQLLMQFARAGYLVFFCPPQTRTDFVGYFGRVAERLYLCGCIDWLYELTAPIVLISKPQHDEPIRHFRGATVIYDCLDDLAVHSATGVVDPRTLKRHQELLRSAAIVCATAERLYEEVRQVRPDTLLVPNGADFDHFHLRDDPPVPTDLAPIVRLGQPIIGYYGALAEWFDFDLLYDVAGRCREYSFVLIGPDYDGAVRAYSAVRPRNVHVLGERRYEDLPAYLHYFAVATIPFRITDVTRATSPIKLFEYMAAGKPIVTTKMPECCRHEQVLTADDAEEFAGRLAKALRLKDDPEHRRALLAAGRANSWQARFAAIQERLDALAGRPAGAGSQSVTSSGQA